MKPSVHVQVEHSLICADSIASIMADEYDIGTISECRLLSSTLNDVYGITAVSGQYIARLSPSKLTTQQDPFFELELLEKLGTVDAKVSAPIRSRGDVLCIQIQAPEGSRILSVFRAAGGRYIGMNKADYGILGRALADLHLTMCKMHISSKGRELNLDHLMDEPLSLLSPLVGESMQAFQVIAESVRRKFERGHSDDLRWGLCHGDAWGNINIDEEGTHTFFDFEFCGPGWLAYDVATINWGIDFVRQDMTIWESFYAAYCERNPLTQAEVNAIPLFIVVRDFWALGNLVANAQRWGHGKLTSDYFTHRLNRMKRLAATIEAGS